MFTADLLLVLTADLCRGSFMYILMQAHVPGIIGVRDVGLVA